MRAEAPSASAEARLSSTVRTVRSVSRTVWKSISPPVYRWRASRAAFRAASAASRSAASRRRDSASDTRAFSTSSSAERTAASYWISACSWIALWISTWERRRPPSKITPATLASRLRVTAPLVLKPPRVSASSPIEPLSVKPGYRAAFAWPTRAVSAASLRSAAWTSGRWTQGVGGNPDRDPFGDRRNRRGRGEPFVHRSGRPAQEYGEAVLRLGQGGRKGRDLRARLLHVGPGLLHVQRGDEAGLRAPFGELEGFRLAGKVLSGDGQPGLEGSEPPHS